MSFFSEETLLKIKTNAEIKLKSLSSLAVAGATVGAGWYFSKSAADQQALIAQFPILIPYSPYITGATWVVLALWPQWIQLSKDKAAKAQALIADAAKVKADLAEALAKIALLTSTSPTAAPAASNTLGTIPEAAPVFVTSEPLPAPPSVPPAELVKAQLGATLGVDIITNLQNLYPELTLDQIKTAVASTPVSPNA